MANIFTAYTLYLVLNQSPRPLTFLWNGGPGSSSSLVHLLGFGPRRLEPYGTAVDNQGTWLDQTDLVFVDPVGTGDSRPAKAELVRKFIETRGDAESVAEFIASLIGTVSRRGDAPLFLAGESFGVTRAAGVADVLQRRRMNAEMVSSSSVLRFRWRRPSCELRTALILPTYTAAAFANKKLAPELQSDLQATLRLTEAWAQLSTRRLSRGATVSAMRNGRPCSHS